MMPKPTQVDMTSLSTFNTARMDVTMRNMQESLSRISNRLHSDLIPAAEQDMVLAEELVGVDHLEKPDITKAMDEATRVRFLLPNTDLPTNAFFPEGTFSSPRIVH